MGKVDLKDLQLYHFENGRNFDSNDFEAYKLVLSGIKAKIINYIICMVGFSLGGFVIFSLIIGGAVGNLLALISVFVGIGVASIITRPHMNLLKEYSNKLGITNKDIEIARNHLKYGTYAWQPEEGNIYK